MVCWTHILYCIYACPFMPSSVLFMNLGMPIFAKEIFTIMLSSYCIFPLLITVRHWFHSSCHIRMSFPARVSHPLALCAFLHPFAFSSLPIRCISQTMNGWVLRWCSNLYLLIGEVDLFFETESWPGWPWCCGNALFCFRVPSWSNSHPPCLICFDL